MLVVTLEIFIYKSKLNIIWKKRYIELSPGSYLYLEVPLNLPSGISINPSLQSILPNLAKIGEWEGYWFWTVTDSSVMKYAQFNKFLREK